MPGATATRSVPGPLASTAMTLPAILAPLLFFIALLPARLLALPLYLLLSGFGAAGEALAFCAWFAVCCLLVLAAVRALARALALERRPRRIFVAAVWLWAVLPNVALVVLFATSAD